MGFMNALDRNEKKVAQEFWKIDDLEDACSIAFIFSISELKVLTVANFAI